MRYLAVIFASPLYFLMRKNWGGFIVNSFFYGCALLLLVSIMGAMIAPFFWLIAVAHASFELRKELTVEAADLFARKMAEQMRNNDRIREASES